MSTRSYDARHRSRHRNRARRPLKLIVGLALPTVAAAAVTVGATGAHVPTFTQTVPASQASTATKNATARSTQLAAAADQTQAVARRRANTIARAARSAQRKDLATRKREAQRAAEAHRWQMAIKNPVKTSGFGLRWGRLHAGEDFATPVGRDLVAMSSGTVIFAGTESGYGNIVKVRYWDGSVSYYGHMSAISVSNGETVTPGQVVGQSGNTGHSTGPHLHLEIHPHGGAAIDPRTWLANHNIG